mmetsp:Transcript_9384/g.20542  ORF Transcript_9384/g.20542 Transcript_9384/m.20542 type:complete len:248 (+) Transcript_9384:1060-1803(+)
MHCRVCVIGLRKRWDFNARNELVVPSLAVLKFGAIGDIGLETLHGAIHFVQKLAKRSLHDRLHAELLALLVCHQRSFSLRFCTLDCARLRKLHCFSDGHSRSVLHQGLGPGLRRRYTHVMHVLSGKIRLGHHRCHGHMLIPVGVEHLCGYARRILHHSVQSILARLVHHLGKSSLGHRFRNVDSKQLSGKGGLLNRMLHHTPHFIRSPLQRQLHIGCLDCLRRRLGDHGFDHVHSAGLERLLHLLMQ